MGQTPCRSNPSPPTSAQPANFDPRAEGQGSLPESPSGRSVESKAVSHRCSVWLPECKKRCMNSKTEGLKCNSMPSQRRFLSMNQSLWTGAPRGSSPGPGGHTYEHLKILLDDTETTELLMSACERLAQGKIPMDIRNALMEARLTALSKPLGGVIFISIGSTIRRLVARTLEQFIQNTLSTRAGTDCVGYLLHATTDADPRVTVLSVDGRGPHDHVLRSAMLGRLINAGCKVVASIRSHVVGATFERVNSCVPSWTICISCVTPAATLARVAGIQLHQGKFGTEVIPDNIDQLGPEVWQPEGITVLGTPIGTEQHVSTEDGTFGQREGVVGSARSAVCLAASAPKRKQTLGRTTPCAPWPEGMWDTAKTLLDGVPEANKAVSTLPMRMGGLGLRSTTRCAPAAYWASWADALHMISQRTPDVAHDVLRRLSLEEPIGGCLGELHDAQSELDRKGFWWRPSWPELHEGKRPPKTEIREPGEWPHGWQYWVSSTLDTSFRKSSMLTGRPPSHQAHLRTHSGLNAGIVFAHALTTLECTVPLPGVTLGELNLPLPIKEAVLQRVP